MSVLAKRLCMCVLIVAMLILSVVGASCGETTPKTPSFTPGSWSLVLLPDTQKYSLLYPGMFTLQTHWIAKNKDKYDIRYVLHLGDVTDENTALEWQRASDALRELDGKVPYALVTGNHDYTPSAYPASDNCGLNEYFPISRFQSWPTFGGVMKAGKTTNSYHLFSAGGSDWIILALEYAPRDETVQWANDVLSKHPRRKAILVTHAYLFFDGTRYDHVKKQQAWNPHAILKRFKLPDIPINDGEELWQKLVRKNNFAFTFNGHVLGSGLGFLSSNNDRGKTTHQMLVNYQGRLPFSGEGYLRILEFLPEGKTVRVKSYSPLYDKYLTDPGNQFTIELDR